MVAVTGYVLDVREREFDRRDGTKGRSREAFLAASGTVVVRVDLADGVPEPQLRSEVGYLVELRQYDQAIFYRAVAVLNDKARAGLEALSNGEG